MQNRYQMAQSHAFLTFGLKFQVKVHGNQKNNREGCLLAFPNFTKTGKTFPGDCIFWQSFDPASPHQLRDWSGGM